MIERRLHVKGTVQKVGYRDLAQELASEQGIVGYVKNLRGNGVEILCQGEREQLDVFMKTLWISEEFVEVRAVELVEERTMEKTDHEFFDIHYDQLAQEFGERMIQGIKYMRDTRDSVNKMGKELHDFREETGRNFLALNDKYHTVSTTLGHMDEKLGVLERVDKKLETLDRVDKKLETLDRVDKKLETLDRVDKKLETLDSMDKKLETLGRIENKLESMDEKLDNRTTELRKPSKTVA
jgi:acylphosphatase